MKAIDKTPEARFGSMAEFAMALEEYLQTDTLPISTEFLLAARALEPTPAVAGARPSTFARHARRWVFGASLVALLTLAAAVMFFASYDRGPTEDLIQPGTRWSGFATFMPPITGTIDYQIRILTRNGRSFEALCQTEQDQYRWVIVGMIDDGIIRWTYHKVVHEAK